MGITKDEQCWSSGKGKLVAASCTLNERSERSLIPNKPLLEVS